jgi:hypothetical protein
MKRLVAVVLLVAALCSCHTGPVRRISKPAVNIQQLTVRADGSWSIDLRIDNFSSVPMRFDRATLSMSVDGQLAGNLQGQPALSIGPEAADVATLAVVPTSAAKIAIADALARGGGIGYTLKGTLDAAPENGGVHSYDVERNNTLNAVPGLPGVMR